MITAHLVDRYMAEPTFLERGWGTLGLPEWCRSHNWTLPLESINHLAQQRFSVFLIARCDRASKPQVSGSEHSIMPSESNCTAT